MMGQVDKVYIGFAYFSELFLLLFTKRMEGDKGTRM